MSRNPAAVFHGRSGDVHGEETGEALRNVGAAATQAAGVHVAERPAGRPRGQ